MNNLSPLPWKIDFTPEENLVSGYNLLTFDDKVMCIQAREFLEITTKRGWGVKLFSNGGWGVIGPCLPLEVEDSRWPDPFTAILESDKWWKICHGNDS